jgi:hypothetical protein
VIAELGIVRWQALHSSFGEESLASSHVAAARLAALKEWGPIHLLNDSMEYQTCLNPTHATLNNRYKTLQSSLEAAPA